MKLKEMIRKFQIWQRGLCIRCKYNSKGILSSLYCEPCIMEMIKNYAPVV